jgi:hypothetical protein
VAGSLTFGRTAFVMLDARLGDHLVARRVDSERVNQLTTVSTQAAFAKSPCAVLFELRLRQQAVIAIPSKRFGIISCSSSSANL